MFVTYEYLRNQSSTLRVVPNEGSAFVYFVQS